MPQVRKQARRKIPVAATALVSSVGLLIAPSATTVASAYTNPTISLSITSLAYGYTGPVTMNVTGTGSNFVQGGTVVYVLNNGTDVHDATNFQVSSPTSMSFSLGAGLAGGTTYTVEVETPNASAPGGLETETAQLTVQAQPSASGLAIGGSQDPSYLGIGYTDANVSLVAANANLSSSTQVFVQDSSNQPHYNVTGLQVSNGGGGQQNVSFTLQSGLSAGTYKFVLRTNNQDLTVPFTIRNPQASGGPKQITAGSQQVQTVTVDAVNANFSAGSARVTVSQSNNAVKVYNNVTVSNGNELTFNVLAGDLPTAGTYDLIVQDASEKVSFTGYLQVVAAGTPTAVATPTSVQTGYTSQTVSVATTNLSLGVNSTVTIHNTADADASHDITVQSPLARGTTEVIALPSGLGVGNYTITVTDQNDSTKKASASFAVVGAPPTAITTAPAQWPTGVQGQSYSNLTLSANGTGPFTWTVVGGSLPSGLGLDKNTGVISGTLSNTAATSTFTVQAASAYGNVQSQFKINVTQGAVKPAITSGAQLSAATKGQSYTATLAASGTAPLNWSVDSGSSLPAGLSLDANTGVISGTVTANSGTYNFTVKVTNAAGTDAKVFTVVVNAAASGGGNSGGSGGNGNGGGGGNTGGSSNSGGSTGIGGGSSGSGSTITIPDTTVPAASKSGKYNLKLSASGGANLTWSLKGGQLPAGLTLNKDGTITGTLKTGAKTETFTVQATDDSGNTVTKSITITVTTDAIANAAVASGDVNTPYQLFLKSSLSGDVTWTIADGQLPPGLTVQHGNQLAGTPKKAGTYTYTLQATDGTTTLTNTYTIKVGKATTSTTYSDVSGGTSYSTAIALMSEMHYIWGYQDGSFKPNDVLTRAQFTGYLYQLLADLGKVKLYRADSSAFKDVKDGYYAYNQINTLAHYGYIDDANKFHPDWKAEQWWVAQVLMNALGQDYSKDNVYDALNQSRLNGVWAIPNSYRITRAQTAAVLDEVFQYLTAKSGK